MKKAGSLIITLFLFWIGSLVYAQGVEKPAAISLTTSVLVPVTTGDREKFEEDHWVSRNTSGGIEDFSYLKEYKNGDSLEAGAKVDPNNNDYAFKVDYEKEGVGSLKFAFKEFRKYFDGTGGFYPLFVATAASPTTYSETSPDLHMDIGDIKLQGILAREGQPKYSFSYERYFKHGTKSLLMWGTVTGAGNVQKKIYPNYLELDEVINRFKFGVEHTIKNVNVSAEQLYENAKAENNNIYNETKTLSNGLVTAVRTQYENFDYDLYSTILRADKTWAGKVFSSLGFMFNRYVGGSLIDVTDPESTSTRHANPATIEQESVVFLPNVSFSPMKDLSVDTGLRFELLHKRGFAEDNQDRLPNGGNGVDDRFVNAKTSREDRKFAENLGFKYNKFKDVVLYGEADLEQRFIDLHELQDSPTASSRLQRITDSNEFDNNFTAGGKWYILSNLDLTTEFKNKNGWRNYKHILKSANIVGSYPAFINEMRFITYTPVMKLNYKPFRWLSCNFGYNYEITEFGIRTFESAAVEQNSYKAHVYSTNVTLTPCDSLYFTVFYQKKTAATRTRANGDGGSGASLVYPIFNGGADVAGLTFSFAPDAKNTIRGSYSMSRADNFNDYSGATQPLALGLDNFSQTITIGIEHQLRKDLSVEFRYSHEEYKEDSNDSIDNYDANLFYTALKMKF